MQGTTLVFFVIRIISKFRRAGRVGLVCGWFVLAAAFVLGCDPTRRIPLAYKPTQMHANAVMAPAGSPAICVVVTDGRSGDPAKIGENQEGRKPVNILARPESPPTKVIQDAFSSELTQKGYKVVADPAGAGRVLQVKLMRFWAQESPSYEAQVLTETSIVAKPTGRVLWTGTLSGDDSTFGRSFSTENYNQVLSNSTIEMVAQAMTKPEFQSALSGRWMP